MKRGIRYHKITSSFNPSIEDLPENVMADIFSRLAVKTIIHCKSVCKNWRELVSDSYFINLHLLRSPRCVMIHRKIQPDLVSESDSEDEDETGNFERPGIFECLEIEGVLNASHLHHAIVTSLDLNDTPIFKNTKIIQVGSVNGLVCLWQYHGEVVNTYVCNPITREYVILPRPQYTGSIPVINNYGFGVGLVTKEYKVIWMFLGTRPPASLPSSMSYLLKAEVCTLGTGQWRRLGRVPYFMNGGNGLFLNGCVHWIVNDKHSSEKLCSFNIDNETFELFPSPPSKEIVDDFRYQSLGILNGCLSLSDSSSSEHEFTIWCMKEYGFKKSWCKEVVIKRSITPDVRRFLHTPVYLIESSDDGTILMLANERTLLVYCPQKKTIGKRAFYQPYKPYFSGKAYRPSFVKLQTSKSERVHIF